MRKVAKVSLITITALMALVIAFSAGMAVRGQNEPKTVTTVTKTAPAKQSTPPTRAELLKLVNAERKKVGVAPLKESKPFDRSAQCKADDEAIYGYFGHYRNGELIGRQCILDMTSGIKCVDTSENLTENTRENTAQSAVAAWVASKPHREAMVNPKYTLTGFGIAGNQIVEHFCEQ